MSQTTSTAIMLAPLARLARFYETLSAHSLQKELAHIYAPDADFKDPFNEVRGLPAIEAIFQHMFRKVKNPRFVVTMQVQQGREAFLTWDFLLHFAGREQCIRGASHIRFNDAGMVVMHRDYWDAAEELYEKLPLVGKLMRFLKRASKAG
jgi:steroid Delta-isomerase